MQLPRTKLFSISRVDGQRVSVCDVILIEVPFPHQYGLEVR